MSRIANITVGADEAGMRLDRWFKEHYPGLGFGQLQKLVRTGQVRVDGGRVKTSTRLEPGQTVRIPPVGADAASGGIASKAATVRPTNYKTATDRDAIEAMILHEDEAVMVLNKPYGLAVQGGSGTKRHIDGMLEAFRDRKGQKPRLVHRLDKDTSGVLLIAKTRLAAAELARAFKARSTKKVYWAIVKGVPRPIQGRISTYLAKETGPNAEKMAVSRHGDPDADHALSLYSVVEASGSALSWVTLRPVTGRTHQLRVHAAHIGHPIIGDPKYFEVENWELPGGIQNRLHLHARRIILPHPKGGTLDASAPLPQHMQQTWNLLSFDLERYADAEELDEE